MNRGDLLPSSSLLRYSLRAEPALPLLIKPKKTGDSLAFHSALNNLTRSQSSFVRGKLKQMFAHRDKKWRGKFISTGTNSNGPVQLLRGQGRAVLVAGRAECAFSNSRSFDVTVCGGEGERRCN